MIERPRRGAVDALKAMFETERDRPKTVHVPTRDVADLIAYVETLEAEVSRLRAAANFGSDAA